jgi:hypothetical protein
MPAYVITYRRPSRYVPEVSITDVTEWVTPPDWTVTTTREHFEASQHGARVIDIIPAP